MSDAPERIWLGRDERYQGEPWIRLASDFDEEESETQEYIRADLAAPDLMAELRDDWDELMAEARAEAAKAMRKFPQPNYVISKIAEEAGEVVKAAIHCAEGRETAENLRGEMKQTLAMLYRLWVEGDQVHGLPPVSASFAKIKEQTK